MAEVSYASTDWVSKLKISLHNVWPPEYIVRTPAYNHALLTQNPNFGSSRDCAQMCMQEWVVPMEGRTDGVCPLYSAQKAMGINAGRMYKGKNILGERERERKWLVWESLLERERLDFWVCVRALCDVWCSCKSHLLTWLTVAASYSCRENIASARNRSLSISLWRDSSSSRRYRRL